MTKIIPSYPLRYGLSSRGRLQWHGLALVLCRATMEAYSFNRFDYFLKMFLPGRGQDDRLVDLANEGG